MGKKNKVGDKESLVEDDGKKSKHGKFYADLGVNPIISFQVVIANR